MRRFFIVGTQGIPGSYGGFETFADELATRLADRGWPVWVTCEVTPGDTAGPAEYRGVRLLYVDTPGNNLRTIVGDRKALLRCAELAEAGDVVYLLGYGVGPFADGAIRRLRRAGVEFWLNPDGLEWKRPRWAWWVRRYFHYCERHLLRRSDRIICDSVAIRDRHVREYGVPRQRTEVIEYGAPLVGEVTDPDLLARRDAYLERYGLCPGKYYVYVGRFVPDNNLELMVRGVLESSVGRRLLVFAAYDEGDSFYRKIRGLIDASDNPSQVILAGWVYDPRLLKALRLAQFAYCHGHEVGGTNPALVEALGLGSFILALDTSFNREVCQDAALYFKKDVGSFLDALGRAEALSREEVAALCDRARNRVRERYNWERITDEYERLLRAGA